MSERYCGAGCRHHRGDGAQALSGSGAAPNLVNERGAVRALFEKAVGVYAEPKRDRAAKVSPALFLVLLCRPRSFPDPVALGFRDGRQDRKNQPPDAVAGYVAAKGTAKLICREACGSGVA